MTPQPDPGGSKRFAQSVPSWVWFVLVVVTYVGGAWLGFQVGIQGGIGSATIPPSGIALAAILLLGKQIWPAIWSGAFVAHVGYLSLNAGHVDQTAILGYGVNVATGAAFQAWLGYSLLEPALGKPPGIRTPADMVRLLVLGGLASTLVNATIGTFSQALYGFMPWPMFGYVWKTWWLGDTAGICLITPVILAWASPATLLNEPRPSWWQINAIIAALIATTAINFTGFSPWARIHLPISYVVLIPVIMAATWLSLRGAATTLLLHAMVATAGTLEGYGPFIWGSHNESLQMLGGYFIMGSLVTLTLSSAVSARERHSTELMKQQSLLRDLMEGTPDAIFIKDRQGRYLLINGAGARYLDKPKGEILYKDDTQLLPPDTARDIQGLDRQVMETRKEITVEMVKEIAGDRRIYLSTKVPYIDQAGNVMGVIGISRDITDAKRAAEAHQQMEVLRQADVMKNRFLSLVSHELRTPLTVTGGYANLLKEKLGPLNERQSDAVFKIIDSTRRQERLVNDLLDMGRVLAGKFAIKRRPMRLSPIVQEVVDSQIPIADAQNVRLTWEDAANSWEIEGDPQRLEQVLTNLLANALKFTPAGGTVHVKLSEQGSMLRCEVADTGPGIPDSQVTYLFQPFSQLSQGQKGGAGLGLAICKEIITAHDGSIGMTPGSGKGSIFWFTLPRRTATPMPPPINEAPDRAA